MSSYKDYSQKIQKIHFSNSDHSDICCLKQEQKILIQQKQSYLSLKKKSLKMTSSQINQKYYIGNKHTELTQKRKQKMKDKMNLFHWKKSNKRYSLLKMRRMQLSTMLNVSVEDKYSSINLSNTNGKLKQVIRKLQLNTRVWLENLNFQNQRTHQLHFLINFSSQEESLDLLYKRDSQWQLILARKQK